MKLKDQIMALYDGKKSTREIADCLGCRIEYVRVVARQRKGQGYSSNDLRYNAKIWRDGDRKAARAAAKQAGIKARDAGLKQREVDAFRFQTWLRTMRQTAVAKREAAHA